MENTAKISISVIGEKSGQPFNGDFLVKTRLTRADFFRADELRRSLIGIRPSDASPAIAGEAFVFAQLSIRVIDSPQWWQDANNGLELEDPNVIGTVFKYAVEKEEERVAKIREESAEALKKIVAKTKKAE